MPTMNEVKNESLREIDIEFKMMNRDELSKGEQKLYDKYHDEFQNKGDNTISKELEESLNKNRKDHEESLLYFNENLKNDPNAKEILDEEEAYASELQDKEKKYQDHLSKKNAMEKEITDSKNAYENLKKEYENKLNEVNEEYKKSGLKTREEEYNKEKKAYEDSYNEQKIKAEQEYNEKKESYDSLKANMEHQIADADLTVDTLNKRISSINATLAEYDAKISKLSSKSAEYKEISQSANDLQNQIKAYNGEIEASRIRKSECKVTLGSVADLKKALDDEYGLTSLNLKEEFDKNMEKVNATKASLDKDKISFDEKKEALKHYEADIDNRKKVYDVALNEKKTYEEKLASLDKDIKDMESKKASIDEKKENYAKNVLDIEYGKLKNQKLEMDAYRTLRDGMGGVNPEVTAESLSKGLYFVEKSYKTYYQSHNAFSRFLARHGMGPGASDYAKYKEVRDHYMAYSNIKKEEIDNYLDKGSLGGTLGGSVTKDVMDSLKNNPLASHENAVLLDLPKEEAVKKIEIDKNLIEDKENEISVDDLEKDNLLAKEDAVVNEK